MIRRSIPRTISRALCVLSESNARLQPIMDLHVTRVPSCSVSSKVKSSRWLEAGESLRRYSKSSKKNRKQAQVVEDREGEFELQKFEKLMKNGIDHLQHELANIRMGRATPGMLDHLKVDAYGEKMPMKAVGTVTVRSPQLLAVTVFDPNLADSVASCISSSPLQFNARVEGQEVLVPIPPPTNETIDAMKKLCRSEAEAAKVSVRHTRKLAMAAASQFPSEDEQHHAEKLVQKMTDRFISEIDDIVSRKQKSIVDHTS